MANTPDQVQHQINQTTNALVTALERQNELQRELFNARILLQNKRNDILTQYADTNLHPGGLKDLGSNETARDAAIATLAAAETDAVKQLEFQLLQQQGIVRIAELRHDEARYTLRVLEAEARALACL